MANNIDFNISLIIEEYSNYIFKIADTINKTNTSIKVKIFRIRKKLKEDK